MQCARNRNFFPPVPVLVDFVEQSLAALKKQSKYRRDEFKKIPRDEVFAQFRDDPDYNVEFALNYLGMRVFDS